MTYRDTLKETTERPLPQVGGVLHELYESQAVEDQLTSVIEDVLANETTDLLDENGQAMSDEFRTVLAERMARESKSAIYQYRAASMTAAEADLRPGDLLRMTSAQDDSVVIEYEVTGVTDPESVRVWVQRVGRYEDGESVEFTGKQQSFKAGWVYHEPRFEIEREREVEVDV